MFWFIVAVILGVIVWRQRANKKREVAAAYQQGAKAGRQALASEIAALKKDGKVSQKKLFELLALPKSIAQAPVTATQKTVQLDDDELETARDDEVVRAEQTSPEVEQEASVLETAQPVAPPTQADIEAASARRTLRNLNAILYVGSFLIVAATALFVNLTMPEGVRLGSMLLMTVAFYVAGLVLHARSERLRSASVAFAGTGLAIVPFLGFAFHLLGGVPPEVAWLVTSVIGLVAYLVAAVRMQNEFISYAAMAFVLSLALSLSAAFELAMWWYFVATIVVSLVSMITLALWPKALPKVLHKPLRDTGIFVTPVALIASLLLMDGMEAWMYQIVFGLATAQYLMAWTFERRWRDELLVRILGHITGLLVAAELIRFASLPQVLSNNLVMIVALLAQVAYSLWRVRLSSKKSMQRETAWIGVMLFFLVSLTMVSAWQTVTHPYIWCTLALCSAMAVCAATAKKFRQIGWLYGVVAGMLVLPFMIGRGAVDPAVSFSVLAVFFAAISIACVPVLDTLRARQTSRSIRLLVAVTAAANVAALLWCGVVDGTMLTQSWTLTVAGAVLIGVSLSIRRLWIELNGVALGVAAVYSWLHWALDDTMWWWLLGTMLSVAATAVGAAVHHRYKQYEARDALVAAGVVVGTLLVAVFDLDETVTRVAVGGLAVAAVASLVLRAQLHRRSSPAGIALGVAYVGYLLLALFGALSLGDGWPAAVLVTLTGVLWASSYIEKQPWVTAAANLVCVMALAALWSWLDFSATWASYGVLWLAAALFYGLYWQMRATGDAVREAIHFYATITVLGVAATGIAFIGMTYADLPLASAGSLLALAAVVGVRGYLQKNRTLIEGAVYVGTCALQWATLELVPEVNAVALAHWWAATIGLVALWRKQYLPRMMVAAGIVTLSTGVAALALGGNYIYVFLIEHLVLLVVAGVLRTQWALWWAVAAIVVAVLYFLRDFTAVLLLFLGFLLILFVVWRLMKMSKNK